MYKSLTKPRAIKLRHDSIEFVLDYDHAEYDRLIEELGQTVDILGHRGVLVELSYWDFGSSTKVILAQ